MLAVLAIMGDETRLADFVLLYVGHLLLLQLARANVATEASSRNFFITKRQK